MKSSHDARNPGRFILLCIAVLLVGSVPGLLSARAPSTSVNIVNDSSRAIRHLYLSDPNGEGWGGDQLNGAISSGQSVSLNGIACTQSGVKLNAEDQDGCFLSTTVSCGDSITWTLTNDTTRDCGTSE